MYYILLALFFILGLVAGSFLNVVIDRLYEHKSLSGRSHCPKCKHKLGVIDLVPIFSFLIQGGKCRYCHKNISWQYLGVELCTGIVFVLVFFNFIGTLPAASLQNIFVLIFYLIISCFLIIIFVYDFKHYLILDKIVIPAIIIALIGNLLQGEIWWSLLLGAIIAGGLFLFQFVVSGGRWIGGGDIRLGVLIGVLLGWKLTLIALFLAYFLGAIFGIILIIIGKKKIKDTIPFGTFLSMSTLVSLLYGNIILDWYLSLLYI